MSIGTFGETSLRGEMKIFRKNHGPSVLLKSASTLVISNDDKLLFSQDGGHPWVTVLEAVGAGTYFTRGEVCLLLKSSYAHQLLDVGFKL